MKTCEMCGKQHHNKRFCSRSCVGLYSSTTHDLGGKGKSKSPVVRQKIRDSLTGNVLSEEHRSNIAAGVTRTGRWTYSRKAREYYGTSCYNCGKDGGIPHVHHLYGEYGGKDKDVHDLGGLVVLCSYCHMNVAHENLGIHGKPLNKDFSNKVLRERGLPLVK